MPIRILVVDEAAFVRDALKRALRRFLKDVDIFDALNGNRAISTLRTNKIDVIIADWELPELSGSELLRWARENENYAKTPFVVLSDSMDRVMVQSAVEGGANDLIAKPFSPDEVQKKIVKQLNRIGYKPKGKNAIVASSSPSSLDLLTSGGGGGAKKPQIMKPREIKSAGALFGGGAAAKKAAPKANTAKAGNFNGTAHIHFEDFSVKCDVRELSLTGLSGIAGRENIPKLFDIGSADIENAKGEPLAQLRVYVHALQASDPRADASAYKLTMRFTENEPEKFELLSKAVTK